ncbi:hypothetical protein [Amycolatopsis speibonae]|uniref:Uncharacterized protein n=1 Tax=Amycolatopsis speibonae TaxID=1450224 RepID=A0ABV7P346_9PSEU
MQMVALERAELGGFVRELRGVFADRRNGKGEHTPDRKQGAATSSPETPMSERPPPVREPDRTTVDTVAGGGDMSMWEEGGSPRAAGLTRPGAVAVAPDGTVYVATGTRILAIDQRAGTIRTFAGTGETGFGGDGGEATKATFS